MIQSSTYKDNDQNSIGNGHQNNNNRHRNRNRRERNGSIDEDYEPSTSYFRSFCRSCFTFQHFCYVVQFINCGLVCGLIYLALIEYPKIEALEAQVEEDKKEIADLDEEVREKQEGQIQILHKAVEQEQQFNFLTLAGTFTLLTCLISMFHMTTHVHRFTQPKIQRKIIAILWMSPIYSVTSFLSLIFPSVEGWMAIIKDFYESYCIYVFLSFLIAVLGEGSRDKAVEVLAKHAGHLDRPTRCLTCFYDPPPDTSDLAKAYVQCFCFVNDTKPRCISCVWKSNSYLFSFALCSVLFYLLLRNAVMTQCQIYCLQFTLVRPLTTIFSVFVLRRGKHHLEEDEDYNEDDEFNDDTYDFNNDDNTIETDGDIDSNNENNNQKNTTDVKADESSPTDASMGEEPITDSSSPQFGNATSTSNPTSDGNDDNGGTRMLQDAQNKRLRRKRTQTRQDRWLQQEQAGEEEEDTTEMSTNPSIESSINDNDGNIPPMGFPSIAPVSEGDGYQFPTFLTPTIPIEGMPIGSSPFAPSFASSNTNGFVPTFDPISGVIPGPENDAASSFDYNSTGLNGIFDTNSTSNFTMAPSLPDVVNDTGFDSSELVDQTKAYFKSPGFALAMIVNVSIFFAFTGLLKLYHAVREDLLWCRPFPKFLTIKAVVFLTFWQGLAILLWLILTAEPGEKEEAFLQAHKYQNLLICVEMLLVAISQWVSMHRGYAIDCLLKLYSSAI